MLGRIVGGMTRMFSVRPERLVEWTPSDGWSPICAALHLPVPDEPFPITNTTSEFRAMVGLDPPQ